MDGAMHYNLATLSLQRTAAGFYVVDFLSPNEKSPSISARAFILSWRSGRDSNPRPPA